MAPFISGPKQLYSAMLVFVKNVEPRTHFRAFPAAKIRAVSLAKLLTNVASKSKSVA